MQSSSPDRFANQLPTAVKALVKPRLRGVSHRYAFFAALPPCFLLVSSAPSGRATVACVIYTASLVGLLGTSAAYHGITWSQPVRFWLARLDLLMIFVLIAGTHTPVQGFFFRGVARWGVITLMWTLVAVGVTLFSVFYHDLPCYHGQTHR